MLTIAQIGISIFGCAAFLLVTRESRRAQVLGVVFGLCSNPFWWMMVVATEQWITIPLHAAYTYGWLSKAWRLRWPPNTRPLSEKAFADLVVKQLDDSIHRYAIEGDGCYAEVSQFYHYVADRIEKYDPWSERVHVECDAEFEKLRELLESEGTPDKSC